MRACGGTWVAHGSGDADRETADAARPRSASRPDDPSYLLRRVWLTKDAGGGVLLRVRQQRPLAALPLRSSPGRPSTPPTGRPTARSTSCSPTPSSRRPATSRRSSSSRTTTSPCCRGCSRRRNAEPDRRPVLAHPVAEPARRSGPSPGRTSCSTGCSATTCSGSTLQLPLPELPGDGRPDASSPGSTASGSPSRAAGTTTLVRPFPISIDSDAATSTSAAGREVGAARPCAGGTGSADRGSSWASGVDRVDYTKGIPERLPGRRPAARDATRSTAGGSYFVQVGVPSRTAPAGLPRPRTTRSTSWSSGSTGGGGPTDWQPVVYLKRALRAGRDDGPAPAGRLLRGQLAARRDEPGGQGVRRQPDRRGRGAGAEPSSPGRPAS